MILRVRTRDLADAAVDGLRLCSYNSGAPRCNRGRQRPRGPDTFVPPGTFPRRASQVVEVVVHKAVSLPDHVEIARDPGGPFVALGVSSLRG